jgi:hypothetical protein
MKLRFLHLAIAALFSLIGVANWAVVLPVRSNEFNANAEVPTFKTSGSYRAKRVPAMSKVGMNSSETGGTEVSKYY